MTLRSVVGIGAAAVIVVGGASWFAAMPRTGVASSAIPVAVVERSDPLPNGSGVQQAELVRADRGWVKSAAKATSIPRTALDAYASAALTLAVSAPACRLGWNTLAALGAAESDHSAVHGTALTSDGESVPRIIGPALDGSEYTAIADTDGGALDGDSTWDRAVGPLQFLPSTWQSFGADGNDDGVVDPNNIFDASLGAARFLCSTGGDLSLAGAWDVAIRAYNPSENYLAEVRRLAIGYGS